jgi:Methyltransferase FkbM domain
MKQAIKRSKLFAKLLRIRTIFRKISTGSLSDFANTSFGQEGEDLVILRQLKEPSKGFYVEVGALAPQRFSNTWLFYTMGWNGILIEPNPEVKEAFGRTRQRDIFVNEGVSSEEQSLLYQQFEEPALNTFDTATANERRSGGWAYKAETRIRTRPLREILAEHMPPNTKIRVMSIDVEGFDEIVIKSNDWDKFRPEWLIVEILNTNLANISQHSVAMYLTEKNYHPVAKTGHSVIFRENA